MPRALTSPGSLPGAADFDAIAAAAPLGAAGVVVFGAPAPITWPFNASLPALGGVGGAAP